MTATDSQGREVQIGDVVTYPHERGGQGRDRVAEVWCGNQVRLSHGQVIDAATTRLGLSDE